jgi:N-acetylglucosaminyldiphosphoundecaprenol N-acetyl-beta-D-mannosaminyltransferase
MGVSTSKKHMSLTLSNHHELHHTPPRCDAEWLSILGVMVMNTTQRQAIDWIEQTIHDHKAETASVYFVNAHTLNLAADDPTYRQVLNSSDFILADGTGVRWAAKLQGVSLRENMNGTDFVPALLRSNAQCGHSYFLLGGDEKTIAKAAEYARKTFPGWNLAGCHHGFLSDTTATASAIEQINAAHPDVLLVGMGNPVQEQWIDCFRHQLDVRVCMGVGGLFDFWASNVQRAPKWLRKLGHEWLWRLYQQPVQKARRYLVGNPLFLARVLREQWNSRKNGKRS